MRFFAETNPTTLKMEKETHTVNEGALPEMSLMHYAAMTNDAEGIIALSDAGHGVNVHNWGEQSVGDAPMHLAVSNDSAEAVAALVKCGADVNSRSRIRTTPMHDAARRGNSNMILELAKYGASPDAVDVNGWTPMHSAAREGEWMSIVTLAIVKAEIDPRDKTMQTPLHLATRAESVEAIDMLVNLGASVDAKSDYNCTPLHFAVRGWLPLESIRLLVSPNADINVVDNGGETPLDAAWGMVGSVRVMMDENGEPLLNAAYDENIVKFLHAHGAKFSADLRS